MKTKFIMPLAMVCCLALCAAFANSLAGKWKSSFKTPDGNEFQLNYVFKVDSGKLTGSVTSPQGEIPLSSGKVSGTDLSFIVSVNGTDVKNTGKYYAVGDSIGLDVDFMGNKMHSTLKRDSN